jgi:hypothetical protein
MNDIIDIIKSMHVFWQFFFLTSFVWAIVIASRAVLHYFCVAIRGWPPVPIVFHRGDDEYDDDVETDDDDDVFGDDAENGEEHRG